MSILPDITEEQDRYRNTGQTGTEPQEYKTKIDLLYEIAREASSVSDVSRLLDRILRVTQHAVIASAASLILIDEEKGELRFRVVLGDASARIQEMKLIPDSGITSWVARNGAPMFSNNHPFNIISPF